MNFNCQYVRKSTNEDGETELTFVLSDFGAIEQAKQLIKGVLYRLQLTTVKSKRTIEQNAYMWALINEISVARSGERANEQWEIYLEALERSGAKVDYVASLPETEEILKRNFRAIKKMNSFIHNGKVLNTYKVYDGSSKMDKKEMNNLIATVQDMAVESGITFSDCY